MPALLRPLAALLVLCAACGTEPTRTQPIPAFASIHAGGGLSCGLTAAGEAWCWGTNAMGRFGNGQVDDQHVFTPAPALGGLHLFSLSIGWQHVCGIGLDAIAYCWGTGPLGTGDDWEAVRASPTPIAGGLALVQVNAGFLHSCGLTSAGAAYCWGDNAIGQLGTGDQQQALTPVPVVGGVFFHSVSTRQGSGAQVEQNSCGLTSAGEAWCWGGNQGGTLGSGQPETESFVPVAVAGGHVFTSLEASGGYVCAIGSTAELYCWGRNDHVPTLVAADLRWTKVSLGEDHACGLTTTALIYCWGSNDYGQVGIGRGPPTFVTTPTRLYGVDDVRWRDVSAGVLHTCAIDSEGATWCWGFGEQGELGVGDLPAHVPPYEAASPVRIVTSRPAL